MSANIIASDSLVLLGYNPQFRPNNLQILNGLPQPPRDSRLSGEPLHQIERHVVLIPRCLAKVARRVANGEEENGERGNEKVVEADLLRAVDVCSLIEMVE